MYSRFVLRYPRTFTPAECDLALLSASEIYGAAARVCMWQTDGGIVIIFSSPLFLTRSLLCQLTDSEPPAHHLPQPNMSLSYSINTHLIQQTHHSTLLLSIKRHLPSALPSVNSLNNPCHLLALLWLIQPRHTLCNLSVNLSAPPRSHFSQIPCQFPVFLPISNKRQNPSLI